VFENGADEVVVQARARGELRESIALEQEESVAARPNPERAVAILVERLDRRGHAAFASRVHETVAGPDAQPGGRPDPDFTGSALVERVHVGPGRGGHRLDPIAAPA